VDGFRAIERRLADGLLRSPVERQHRDRRWRHLRLTELAGQPDKL
jgi:hypothetical protein